MGDWVAVPRVTEPSVGDQSWTLADPMKAVDSAVAPPVAGDVVAALVTRAEKGSEGNGAYCCWNSKSGDELETANAPGAEQGNARISYDPVNTVDVVDDVGIADVVGVVGIGDALSAVAAREWVANRIQAKVRLPAWEMAHNDIRRPDEVADVMATSHIQGERNCVEVQRRAEVVEVLEHTPPYAVWSRIRRSSLAFG